MTIDPNREAFEKACHIFRTIRGYEDVQNWCLEEVWNAALAHAATNATIRSDNAQVIINLQEQVRVLSEAATWTKTLIKFHVKPEVCVSRGEEIKSGLEIFDMVVKALTNAKQLGKEGVA